MSFSNEMIKKYNLKLSKKFGQNFLKDQSVLDRIIDTAKVSERDLVVEVGPGAGALTREIASKAGHVIAVEIDTKLIPLLNDLFLGNDRVEIINGDVLAIDFTQKVASTMESKNLDRAILVANLPYYITTPVIMKFLEDEPIFDEYVYMVQREVAQRMIAKPGKKDYGALSIAVQFHTLPSIAFEVPPECFIPKPEVYSSVVKLLARKEMPFKINDTKLFFNVVKAGFGQRRKTLLNSLSSLMPNQLNKHQISDILISIGINPSARAETLSLEEFADISNKIDETIK